MRSKRPKRDERHAAIIGLLGEAARVDVSDLAQRFGVNEMTIRRDLHALAEGGKITRVHGGALPPRPDRHERRATVNLASKRAIARVVSGLVADGETVGIDAGTTCQVIAAELAKRSDLRVVTYSIHVALEFKASESEVILLGGRMTRDLSLVDESVACHVDRLALNSFILSCAGFSPDRGVSFFNSGEVAVRRAIAANSDRLILAATSEKWGRHATYVFSPLGRFATFVTDSGMDSRDRKLLARHAPVLFAEVNEGNAVEVSSDQVVPLAAEDRSVQP